MSVDERAVKSSEFVSRLMASYLAVGMLREGCGSGKLEVILDAAFIAGWEAGRDSLVEQVSLNATALSQRDARIAELEAALLKSQNDAAREAYLVVIYRRKNDELESQLAALQSRPEGAGG